MAAQGAEDASKALFARLDAQIKKDQYKKAVKTTDELLQLHPSDAVVLKTRAVLLIELGAFAKNLGEISKAPAEVAPSLAFEKAYCLFRENRREEALAVAEEAYVRTSEASGSADVAGLSHLRAQLLHRLGRHAEAADAYERLLETSAASDASPEDVAEVATNAAAALIASGRAARVPALLDAAGVSPADLPWLGVNAARAALDAGDAASAADLLAAADASQAEAAREGGLDADEAAADRAPVAALLAYLAFARGDLEEAAGLFEAVERGASGDPALAAVALLGKVSTEVRLAAVGGSASAPAQGAGASGRGGRHASGTLDPKKAAASAMRRLSTWTRRSPGGALTLRRDAAARLDVASRASFLRALSAAALASAGAGGPGAAGLARDAASAAEAEDAGAPEGALLRAAARIASGRREEAERELEAAAAAAGETRGQPLLFALAQLRAARGEAAAAKAALDALAGPGGAPRGGDDGPSLALAPGVALTRASLAQAAEASRAADAGEAAAPTKALKAALGSAAALAAADEIIDEALRAWAGRAADEGESGRAPEALAALAAAAAETAARSGRDPRVARIAQLAGPGAVAAEPRLAALVAWALASREADDANAEGGGGGGGEGAAASAAAAASSSLQGVLARVPEATRSDGPDDEAEALSDESLDALETEVLAEARRAQTGAGAGGAAGRGEVGGEAAGGGAALPGGPAAVEGPAVGAKKRKRKTRLPKGHDPANPGPKPDPERWLPKWARSDAKRRRGKKSGAGVRGAQGSGRADAGLDRSGTTAADVKRAPAAKVPRKKGKGRR